MDDLNSDLKSVRSRNLEPKTRLMYNSTKSMFATALVEILKADIENIHPDQCEIHKNGMTEKKLLSRSHINFSN